MILEVKKVSKHFGGLRALHNVNLVLEKGEILGLIGPNGAGKTTLFNVINGVYLPSEGKIYLDGEDITPLATYEVAHRHMARTHQVVKPLNELTVLENVIVGACFGGDGKNLDDGEAIAREIIKFVKINVPPEQLASSLNVAQKKRLELARALAAQPKVLLLDEVLAGLNPTEIANMVETVREIRDQGISIIMIEHVMHAVMNVSDRMVVLDYGELIAEGTPQEITDNEKVIEAYLGDPKIAQALMERAH